MGKTEKVEIGVAKFAAHAPAGLPGPLAAALVAAGCGMGYSCFHLPYHGSTLD